MSKVILEVFPGKIIREYKGSYVDEQQRTCTFTLSVSNPESVETNKNFKVKWDAMIPSNQLICEKEIIEQFKSKA